MGHAPRAGGVYVSGTTRPTHMRRFAFMIFLSAAGCDSAGADVATAPGRFTAEVSGARTASVAGEASFPTVQCGGRFAFEDGSSALYLSKACFENGDRAREARYAIAVEDRPDAFRATFVASDGALYTGVAGSVEFVDVERDRIEGRFSIEAQPADADGRPVTGAAAPLTIAGEFNAESFQPPPGYD